MKRVIHSTAFNLDEIPDISVGRDRELVTIDDAFGTRSPKWTLARPGVIGVRAFFGGLSGRDGGGSERFRRKV